MASVHRRIKVMQATLAGPDKAQFIRAKHQRGFSNNLVLAVGSPDRNLHVPFKDQGRAAPFEDSVASNHKRSVHLHEVPVWQVFEQRLQRGCGKAIALVTPDHHEISLGLKPADAIEPQPAGRAIDPQSHIFRFASRVRRLLSNAPPRLVQRCGEALRVDRFQQVIDDIELKAVESMLAVRTDDDR